MRTCATSFRASCGSQIRSVEAPLGAHPTSAAPDYQLDLGHLKTYVESAAAPEAWAAYRASYIDIPASTYLDAVGGEAAIRALPRPVY